MRTRSRSHGYLLMEVMLAVGIFAMAGVGLISGLNELSKTYVQSRRINEIRTNLESQLNNARIMPLVVGKQSLKPDADGVAYETEVALLELTNDDKVVLANLYRLTVTAHWNEGNVPQDEKAEVYIYQP